MIFEFITTTTLFFIIGWWSRGRWDKLKKTLNKETKNAP